MKKSKGILLSTLINRKAKCKYTRTCGLYTDQSYTCTHTGGSYCGKFRKFSRCKDNFKTETSQLLMEIPQ